jgi:NADH-quinone oxidoreductase subunit A
LYRLRHLCGRLVNGLLRQTTSTSTSKIERILRRKPTLNLQSSLPLAIASLVSPQVPVHLAANAPNQYDFSRWVGDFSERTSVVMEQFYPVLIYVVVLVGFVATNLLLAQFAGPRKRTTVKQMPYESGMDPVGDARQPFDVKFYIVAILFLVFDVELLFLYPWATSAYVNTGAGIPPELRGTVFAVMLVFMATLVIAYIYAWRKGVFRWR